MTKRKSPSIAAALGVAIAAALPLAACGSGNEGANNISTNLAATDDPEGNSAVLTPDPALADEAAAAEAADIEAYGGNAAAETAPEANAQ